jgi:hypothetical protein
MKRATEEAIEKLPDYEKIELIYSYEQFERDGFIGECKLRDLANSIPEGHKHVTTFMTLIATECYRYFAHKNIEQTISDYSLRFCNYNKEVSSGDEKL